MARLNYFQNIKSAIITSGVGLKLSMRHMLQVLKKRKQDVTDPDFFLASEGTATLQFPHETIPVPDNGRYKLHNEIDDCIVCDKCAKVCPVNCIDIIPIRSPDSFGETSDGTPKRIYAETFDIDMSKCMFCGLCTTVCPTECLTMTGEYDYSTFDVRDHIFPFDNMSESEVTDKKKVWEKHQELKAAEATEVKPKTSVGGKPVFKPKLMQGSELPGKPKFKPRVVKKPSVSSEENMTEDKLKPKFKPRVIPKKPKNDD